MPRCRSVSALWRHYPRFEANVGHIVGYKFVVPIVGELETLCYGGGEEGRGQKAEGRGQEAEGKGERQKAEGGGESTDIRFVQPIDRP